MPETPPKRFSQSKTARLARARLERLLAQEGNDLALWNRVQSRVPDAWATLEDDVDCRETKVKVTLRVDASVAKFYRAMGQGYQDRMNRILATYAQMKIGEVNRAREISTEAEVFLADRLPEELGQFYRKHREVIKASGETDGDRLDRLFDLG